MVFQSDGKILLGGNFTQVNGVTCNSVARLNTNGTLDTAFTASATASSYVYALAVQAGGKVVIGGTFVQADGVARNHLARLNADGTLDTAYNPATDDTVRAVAVQADGKLLVGATSRRSTAPRISNSPA